MTIHRLIANRTSSQQAESNQPGRRALLRGRYAELNNKTQGILIEKGADRDLGVIIFYLKNRDRNSSGNPALPMNGRLAHRPGCTHIHRVPEPIGERPFRTAGGGHDKEL